MAQGPKGNPKGRDFPRAQAIFHSISYLKSQCNHSRLTYNGPAAAVAYAAVSVVAANEDSAVAVEFFCLVEAVLAAMLQC